MSLGNTFSLPSFSQKMTIEKIVRVTTHVHLLESYKVCCMVTMLKSILVGVQKIVPAIGHDLSRVP